MSVELEDQRDDDIRTVEWGKSRIARLKQKEKAIQEKEELKKRGWGRYLYRGTCGFCESFTEQTYAGIIDICTHCCDKAILGWKDRKIYFQLVKVKPNLFGERCQVCNRNSPFIHQVNIKMCIKCLQSIGKLYKRKNAKMQLNKKKELNREIIIRRE